MQMRDWIIGLIGLGVGAVGILSLLKIINLDLSRSVLIWVSAIAGIILLYAAIIEVTNSNLMGTITIIIAAIAIILSLLPALYSVNILGNWAAFSWVNETFYKIILTIEGIFLMIATFAMEL